MRTVTLLAVLGALGILSSGCRAQEPVPINTNQRSTDDGARDVSTDGASPDLATLAARLGIPLPAGTRVLWVDQQSGIDDMVRAKLQMSRVAFGEIAGQLPLREEELRGGAGRLGTDLGPWDPHATKGLRSGQAQLEGGRYLNLGIADGGDGILTLFVMNHGT